MQCGEIKLDVLLDHYSLSLTKDLRKFRFETVEWKVADVMSGGKWFHSRIALGKNVWLYIPRYVVRQGGYVFIGVS